MISEWIINLFKANLIKLKIIGNTLNGSLVRESYQLFYELQKKVSKHDLKLEIDDLSPCDLSQNNVKKLKVTNLEQINSTLNRYGASMYNKYKQ